MKTAILIGTKLRPKVIDEKTLQDMRAYTELALCPDEDITKECALALMEGADAVITSWGSPKIDSELLAKAPALKLHLHAAGSVKPVVSDELYASGVKVVSSACALSYGVSETALGLTILSLKNMIPRTRDTAAGGWSQEGVRELYGLTIGVIGYGFAGRHYAELLKPFDVDVLAYDPFITDMKAAQKAELSEVFEKSDLISIHAPSIDATRHMINDETISLMKRGVILINTARGSLIDEDALARALLSGQVGFACIDVTDPEPPAKDSPLRNLRNCFLTPHIAGLAGNGQGKIGRHCLKQLENFINGSSLEGEVSQASLATIA